MDIVILANFTMDFSVSDNGRFSYLADLLSKSNSVEVITSDFYHITKSQRAPSPKDLPYEITFLHEPGYPKNVCLKRFYSHFIWGINVLRYLKKRKKTDVIYCAVPSLTGPNLVARYCEKNNIRFIIDVQDLWPEAFQMVVDIPIISDLAFMPFRTLADGIYKRANAICAVSDTYCKRALRVNRKCKKGTTVFLGTELETFDNYAAKEPILKKEDDEIWLAYCGTLGSSYDLTCVIDALSMLKNDKVRFIVMGDGPKQNEFKAYAKKRQIKATFTGRLQYDKMCSLLSACDITVNPISHMAAQSIINKHADYLAAGLPILSTQENKEFRALVKNNKIGYNCRNNNAEDLANKIIRLVNNEGLRKEMGRNARKLAEELFDRKRSYLKIQKVIVQKDVM